MLTRTLATVLAIALSVAAPASAFQNNVNVQTGDYSSVNVVIRNAVWSGPQPEPGRALCVVRGLSGEIAEWRYVGHKEMKQLRLGALLLGMASLPCDIDGTLGHVSHGLQ